MPIDEKPQGSGKDWDGVDPEKSWTGWRHLPTDPPPGVKPGSGHWRRNPHTDAEVWVPNGGFFLEDDEWVPSQPPRAMTSPRAETPHPLPFRGVSRSRRAGFRLGRILGMIVRGLLSTRGLNKKQILEVDEGYVREVTEEEAEGQRKFRWSSGEWYDATDWPPPNDTQWKGDWK
jgi:hypothetical protein